ncbi:ATPase family AAA domain-containing protein 5b isoform X2 [Vanacampus margaritifer]
MPNKLKRTKKSPHNVSREDEASPQTDEGSSKRSTCGPTDEKVPFPQSEADVMGRGEKVSKPLSSPRSRKGHVPSLPSLHSFLKDIQASNTAFPVQSVFRMLQKKARDGLPDSEITVESRPSRASRLSNTRRLKQQIANGSRKNCTDIAKTLRTIRKVCSCEDVLWTDKYSPQGTREIIGNILQVNKLHSWLKMWKRRTDCNESKIVEQIKNEEKSKGNISTQDSWDCGDFQGETGPDGHQEALPCNTMLITGPPGVGKTASVYACAQELGFKVFEVNSSSQRNGRQVLCQLREATQSHLVETSGKDLLRPAYFNNYGTRGCPLRSEHLDGGKFPPPKKVCKKQMIGRHRRTGKDTPAGVTLTNFFKLKDKAGMPRDKLKYEAEHQATSQNKIVAASLILFEEVDVIFEDDVGFLAAIKTFMTTTKRPLVLTTNDPTFRERFSSNLEEIVFKKPSTANVCSYLQLLCLAEGLKMEADDVRSLVTLAEGDVRRCLLQLQLWVNSFQGTAEEDARLSQQGCTASMLGLHPVSRNHLLNLLENASTVADMNKLVESWRRDVPLLYSNVEMLLPTINPVRDGLGFSNMTVTGSSLTRKAQRSPYCPKTSAANVDLKRLNALADFFDIMSYIDATIAATAEALDPDVRTRDFVWTGADIKDSLLDETSEEEVRSHSQERMLEIRAVVEALGCRGCWSRMSDVWTEAQTCRPELGQTQSQSSNGIHLTCQPPGDPIICQKRYKMSHAVLSSQPFGLLGNRQAVCVDYLPALRSISRSTRQQKDEPARCVNYLQSLHLGLSKSTLQLLAQDFSSTNLPA